MRAPQLLSPAEKMAKMRRWFEQNEGIPPCRDTRPGFDMGVFWNHCCSGQNRELFAAALLGPLPATATGFVWR